MQAKIYTLLLAILLGMSPLRAQLDSTHIGQLTVGVHPTDLLGLLTSGLGLSAQVAISPRVALFGYTKLDIDLAYDEPSDRAVPGSHRHHRWSVGAKHYGLLQPGRRSGAVWSLEYLHTNRTYAERGRTVATASATYSYSGFERQTKKRLVRVAYGRYYPLGQRGRIEFNLGGGIGHGNDEYTYRDYQERSNGLAGAILTIFTLGLTETDAPRQSKQGIAVDLLIDLRLTYALVGKQ